MPHNRTMIDHNDSNDPTSDSADAAQAASHAARLAASHASTQQFPDATLYVVATPIGNLSDITFRALECLARVDAVAAEDTRTARSLLRHYGLAKPCIAAHRHNEREAAVTIVARIAKGERIAYLSDAGTPAISDPGAKIVAAVRDAGFRVVPIPGASALTAALSAAGLAEGAIHFAGFLPAKATQAATVLKPLREVSAHLVFYEAPHRIVDTMALLAESFGGERICIIARELTKLFETIHRCRLADAAAWLSADTNRQRGEFVVIVEAEAAATTECAHRTLARALPTLEKLFAVLPLSEAASLAADLTGVPRKVLYAAALAMRRDGGDP